MQHIIKNRHGLNIVLDYTEVSDSKGLAFLQHGLGGFKDQVHMLEIAAAFNAQGISTVNFDATHSIGDSDGDLIHASLTNHTHDLVDVIAWARTQDWFQSPFYLAGHSMGGAAALHYARNHPTEIRAIVPLSAIMSGTSWRTTYTPEALQDWQERGYYEKTSASKPGVTGKVGWALMEDAMQHDLSIGLNTLTMPALFIVGTEDDTAPPTNQKIMHHNWGGPKEYHEIEGCGHTFKSPSELAQLKMIIKNWLKNIA
jgi:pimeloyl-ACP methyl ester carboxylesterase